MQEHREWNDVRNNTPKTLTKSQQHKSAVIEDSNGKTLMESKAVLNRWTEYCSDLFNYELHPDTSLLQSNHSPTQQAENLSVLREEVEEAVRNLKAGKSPALDSSPSELLKNRGKATTTVLTACMPEDLGDEGMANGVGTIAHCTLPKKGNFKQCKN